MNRHNSTGVVSVIIPVFNGAQFLDEAIRSALDNEEVGEVILINDGSTDDSLDVCKRWSRLSRKVRILEHRYGKNHGAGLSRNLGLENASLPYVAFLDADDYYLQGRFKQALSILTENDSIDGVHEILGVRYESEASKEKHLSRMFASKKNLKKKVLPIENTGIEVKTDPKMLYHHLLVNDRGWIHVNCLTIRRSSLDDSLRFNSDVLGQDAEFIARLACLRTLFNSSNINPVAVRRVHDGNRITNMELVGRYKPSENSMYWLKFSLERERYDTIAWLIMRCANDANKLKKFVKVFFLLKKYPKTIPYFFAQLKNYYAR